MSIYWIDPGDCGLDDLDGVLRFEERVRLALPAGWTVEILGSSDQEHVAEPVPAEVERVVSECWEDHCRYDGDPQTMILLPGEHP